MLSDWRLRCTLPVEALQIMVFRRRSENIVLSSILSKARLNGHYKNHYEMDAFLKY